VASRAAPSSENALRIQIWTALIAMLLLRWLYHLSKARWSFSTHRLDAQAQPLYLPGLEGVAR
jgi:predicted secreted protein